MLAACNGVGTKRNAVRAERLACLGMRFENRADDLDIAQHCGDEDVDARAVGDEELRYVATAHVAGGAERRLPVSAAPIPRSVDEGRLRGERVADIVEISVCLGDEGVHRSRIERRR